MSFDERKKRARSFEKTTADYVRECYADSYRITEQKRFASGRRPDIWLVGKGDQPCVSCFSESGSSESVHSYA